MNKKIDRALHGPGIIEVACGAVLALILGVVVACVVLAFRPVTQVKEPPKETTAGVVYYLPGSDNLVKGREWQDKQKQFLAGSSVSLSEEELNAWATGLNPPAATKPGALPAKPGTTPAKQAPGKPAPAPAKPAVAPTTPAPAPAVAAPDQLLTVAAPNFRIKNGKLQVAVKATVSAFGIAQELTLIATGGFRKDGAEFVFAPDTIYLGSCPLHKIPFVVAPLLQKIVAVRSPSAEMRAAWIRLTEVGLDGTTLRLAGQ